MSDDNLVDELEAALDEEFHAVRDLGLVPKMYYSGGWTLSGDDTHSEREQALYLAGRASGVSKALEIVKDHKGGGD